MTIRQESANGGAWLLAAIASAGAAANPRQPRLWAAGHVFDAVIVTDRIGIEAVDWYRRLGCEVPPAVIDHRSRRVAFLIAPVGAAFFAGALTVLRAELPHRYLSDGGYLLVPGPGVEIGDRYQWLNAPAEDSNLDRNAIALLAGHLLIAARNLSAAAEGTDDER